MAETALYNLAIIWFENQKEKACELLTMTFDYCSIVRFYFIGLTSKLTV
jgi:hypothetical protein